jgi:hypothetical protein
VSAWSAPAVAELSTLSWEEYRREHGYGANEWPAARFLPNDGLVVLAERPHATLSHGPGHDAELASAGKRDLPAFDD